MRDLEALYDGDELFEKRLNTFLPQWEREPSDRYELRKKNAFYRNYVGAIIDYFSALLFTSKPKALAQSADTKEAKPDPGDYYDTFREDCDRTGTDLDAFFKDRLTDAMVHRCSWFSLEQPSLKPGEAEPTSRSEFEARKLGDCWLRSLEFDQVLDWETNDAGQLAWVLVFSCDTRRAGPSASRNVVTQTWEHYLPDRVDSYSLSFDNTNPPPAETVVPLVATRAHGFGRVPVLSIDLPRALWAANRLRTPQLEHFRSSNAQAWSLKVSCYAMMVFKVGDPESFAKVTVGPARGIVLALDESAEWNAPPSEHFAALDSNIAAQKDEIFRLAHQMALGVENNAAAIGRTAESKSEDAQSTRVILLAYARKVKETIERVYDLLEARRGDKLKWSVEGLDDFADADLIGLVDTVVKLQAFGSIPSRTARVEVFKKLADGLLPDVDQATKSKIMAEIEANTLDPANEPTPEEKLHALATGLTKNANQRGARGGSGTKPPAPTAGGSGSPSPPAQSS